MVLDKIKDIICDEFELEKSVITPEASFMYDLGLDSLDVADLSMTVEDFFEIELPFEDEDIEKIKTVGDLVKYIEENIE